MKSKDQQLLEEAYGLVQLNELFDVHFDYKKSSEERDEEENTLQTVYTFSSAELDQSGEISPFPKYNAVFDVDLYKPSVKITFTCQSTPESPITYDLTGTGKASKVMGTIMAITKEYLEELLRELYSPRWGIPLSSSIIFSAKSSETGRVKFYEDTLIPLLITYLNKKTGIHWQSTEDLGREFKNYIIKPKPSNELSPQSISQNNSSPTTTPIKRSTERFL